MENKEFDVIEEGLYDEISVELFDVVDEFADAHHEIKVCKVNVETEEELAAKFEIMSVPTVLVFKEGKITNRSTGVKTVQQIEDML